MAANQYNEQAFRAWYGERATRLGINPDPDAPDHFYDYRAAYSAGAEPDADGHWPSAHKLEGHPRMVINGVNTKTGLIEERPVPPAGEKDDFSSEYAGGREARSMQANADQFMDWMVAQRGTVAMPLKPEEPIEGKDLSNSPFGTKETPAAQSTAGALMRNIAEIPRAAVLGADSAVRNATDWAFGDLVKWLNTNVADLEIPVRDVTTPTGKVTKSVTEFLTGFVPALKVVKGAGVTGGFLAPTTAAAIADFAVKDPHEPRLSNLWNEFGLPRNILTDYLAASPDDTAIEGRFKSAVESVLTGTAAEGVISAARAVRGARQTVVGQAAADRQLIEKYGELTDADFARVAGDPSKPMIETRVKAPAPAAGKVKKGMAAAEGAKPEDLVGGRGVIDAGEMDVFVNFGRMGGPDDVKAVIADMAERFKGSIKEAQRGTITLKETEAMADQLGMSVPDLLARRRGQPLNAEEAVAARKLWQASGEQLLEAARRAAAPNAGPLDQFAFRKQMAVHHAIQAEVLGARTETARALSAWRIEAGGNIERARAIDQVITAMGGPDASQQMARRLAILAESGDPAAVAKFVEKGWGATGLDAVREVWINGLLSSPATHAVNVTSNTVVAFQQMLERGVAQRIGALTSQDGGQIAPGEAMAMAYGLVTGVKDAFRLAWKAFSTGETGAALNKVDLPMQRSVSAEAFNIGSETGLGRAVDFLGEAARIPSRFLGAEDEFYKTIGYRMELNAQALRQATAEGAKGDALAKRMRELVLDPPENLRIASADAALYNTFTNAPGAIGQAFMNLRERVPAITFILPFVRTPVNIARYTFERTPFAPLVSQWRDDIAAGGARADLALARMATGSTAMLVALDWADSGLISGKGPGPNDKGEREAMLRQGWQPYSVKVGDRWYSYNRTDPLGAMLGFAADAAEAIRRGEFNEDDVDEWQEVMAMGIASVSQVAVNKTYLRGLSEFISVMSDPTRYGERYVNNLVSSFLPYTSLAGAVERAVDPVAREATTPWQAIQAKLAGLSETLPPRRTLWGDEVRADNSELGKAYDFFSPVQASKIKHEPIDTEIMRLSPLAAQDNVESSAPTRIAKRTNFGGVQVNFKEWPQVYDEYVRLAGNELKHPAWQLGAKDFLNEVVQGRHAMSKVYETRQDEMKILFIKQAIHQYRTLAQQQILQDPRFADFAQHVEQLRAHKLETRLPVAQ
jgi:hypothetical protein